MKAPKVMLILVGCSAELGAEALKGNGPSFVEAKPGVPDNLLVGPYLYFLNPWGVSDTPPFSGGVLRVELYPQTPRFEADLHIRVTSRRKALGNYLRFLAEYELQGVVRERVKVGL